MSKIRNLIRERIVSPELDNISIYSTTGKVLKSYEETRRCLVNFINRDGQEVEESLLVKLTNSSQLDGFPEIDDIVVITESDINNKELIISEIYNTSIITKTPDDIYSDAGTLVAGNIGV